MKDLNSCKTFSLKKFNQLSQIQNQLPSTLRIFSNKIMSMLKLLHADDYKRKEAFFQRLNGFPFSISVLNMASNIMYTV